jgi:FkbM family methyltransferase
MNVAVRLLTEYSSLCRVLGPREIVSLGMATVKNAPAVFRTRTLTTIDAAMSRNMTVKFNQAEIVLPLADMDRILIARKDNPSFGNLREIYARNCYLERLKLKTPIRAALDLGANRGMFSVLAMTALGAEKVVGVEPITLYNSVYKLLLEANGCAADRGPRYEKFISSVSDDSADLEHNVSIETILREQNIERFDLVKIDIEGGEKNIFSEPEWLAKVDNITMELHPQFVPDLSLIPDALKQYGFEYVHVDQEGNQVDVQKAMFLYASRTGSLIH